MAKDPVRVLVTGAAGKRLSFLIGLRIFYYHMFVFIRSDPSIMFLDWRLYYHMFVYLLSFVKNRSVIIMLFFPMLHSCFYSIYENNLSLF